MVRWIHSPGFSSSKRGSNLDLNLRESPRAGRHEQHSDGQQNPDVRIYSLSFSPLPALTAA